MKRLNCIVVFSPNKDQILFCKRMKEPYKGLFNFPGGKVEENENPLRAAYRELYEETHINRGDIKLFHFMDLTYYEQNFILEMYVGQLKELVELVEEVNPLLWLPLTENFADADKYAGDQNIAHIVNVARKVSLDERKSEGISSDYISIGVDGCKGGWIAAVLMNGVLQVHRFTTLEEIVDRNPFDGCIIDMVIGLQGKESDIRPDSIARHEMKGRASTIFPAPCREAVYGRTKEERLAANVRVLGKKFTSQTDAIIPKIREVDEFLQTNPVYKNKIQESHPEVCFARLNGSVLMTSKHTEEGIRERAEVLSEYLPEITYEEMKRISLSLKCNMDDITDSICLAIVSNLNLQGKTETIPSSPMMDDTGLLMQMVVPGGFLQISSK